MGLPARPCGPTRLSRELALVIACKVVVLALLCSTLRALAPAVPVTSVSVESRLLVVNPEAQHAR